MIRSQKKVERINIQPQEKDRLQQLAMKVSIFYLSYCLYVNSVNSSTSFIVFTFTKHGKMVDMTEQYSLALFPTSIRKYVIDCVIADSHLSHLLKNKNITPSNLQDWASNVEDRK